MTEARLIEHMPMSEYHGLGRNENPWDMVLSKSQLADMECPAIFKWKYIDNNEPAATDSLNIGTAVHMLALEPDQFHDTFYVLPETWTDEKGVVKNVIRNERHTAYQACLKEADGRTVITASQMQDVEGMARALANDRIARPLLEAAGKIEASILWENENGLKMRCRPDFLRDDGLIVDLKTTGTIAPTDFERTAVNLHYDVSAALTCEGYEALTGKPAAEYVYLIASVKPPYIIQARSTFAPMDESDASKLSYIEMGRYRLQGMLDRFMQCARNNTWPAWLTKIEPMRAPYWALKEMEGENA